MRVELGAPVVLVEGVERLWHVPAQPRARGRRRVALCGLAGELWAYGGFVRRRRCCGVCLRRFRGSKLEVGL